jgi:hypothetical protein
MNRHIVIRLEISYIRYSQLKTKNNYDINSFI